MARSPWNPLNYPSFQTQLRHHLAPPGLFWCVKVESKGMNQIIYRLLHGLQTGSDNVTPLWVLVRMPGSHETDTFHTLAGSRVLTCISRLEVSFSCQVQTSISLTVPGSQQSPGKMPQPSPRGASIMDKWVFTTRVRVFSQSPLQWGSQHKTSRVVVGHLPSRN